METIIAGVQSLSHVWFGFFLGLSIHKWAHFSHLFSKYNYPALTKIASTIICFFAILNLPQLIEVLVNSVGLENHDSPIVSVFGSLAEGGLYGTYLALLISVIAISIKSLEEINEKGIYFKNVEHFSTMSTQEVIQWAFEQLERPTGTHELKEAQNAILINHPDLKEHVLFKTNPNNVRYITPTE